MSIWVSSRI